MQYRNFGKLGLKVSALGFGCMRLPTLENPGQIDEAKATRMLRYAIDHGVNYIDTAWPYHQENSETIVGKALGQGYRERVFLATKSPVWRITKHAEYGEYLDKQLAKLKTDHLDFYLLHAMNAKRWENCRQTRVFDFLERAKAQGKIKHIGFSFHDQLSVFKEIADGYDWDFCQIQYNYMNEEYQAGRAGLHYAGAKGLAVVIMEPLLGGRLARADSGPFREIWAKAPREGSPAAWALRWLWHQPEVSLVLSGMSTMAQVEENVRLAGETDHTLSPPELEMVQRAKEHFLAQTKVACTGCKYCADCPAGIRIDEIFDLYNSAYMYGEREEARRDYRSLAARERDFSRCQDCGLCEEVCPQNLPVRAHLGDFHREFGPKK